VEFKRRVVVHEICLQFQAGFSAEMCRVMLKKPADDGASGEWEDCEETLEPDDSLELQTFPLELPVDCVGLRLIFEDFCDFYGRITLYQMQAWGHDEAEE